MTCPLLLLLIELPFPLFWLLACSSPVCVRKFYEVWYMASLHNITTLPRWQNFMWFNVRNLRAWKYSKILLRNCQTCMSRIFFLNFFWVSGTSKRVFPKKTHHRFFYDNYLYILSPNLYTKYMWENKSVGKLPFTMNYWAEGREVRTSIK